MRQHLMAVSWPYSRKASEVASRLRFHTRVAVWAAVGQRRVKRASSGLTAPLHRNTLAASNSQWVCKRYRQLWLAAAAPPSPSITRREAAEAARLSPQYQQKEMSMAMKVYIRHR